LDPTPSLFIATPAQAPDPPDAPIAMIPLPEVPGRGDRSSLSLVNALHYAAPMEAAETYSPRSPSMRSALAIQAQAIEADEEGNSRLALTLFSQAIAIDPETPNYLLSAGNMHLKLGEPAKALAMYKRCRSPKIRDKLTSVMSSVLGEKSALALVSMAAAIAASAAPPFAAASRDTPEEAALHYARHVEAARAAAEAAEARR